MAKRYPQFSTKKGARLDKNMSLKRCKIGQKRCDFGWKRSDIGQNFGAKLGKNVKKVAKLDKKSCKFGQFLGAKLVNKYRLQKSAILGKKKFEIGHRPSRINI